MYKRFEKSNKRHVVLWEVGNTGASNHKRWHRVNAVVARSKFQLIVMNTPPARTIHRCDKMLNHVPFDHLHLRIKYRPPTPRVHRNKSCMRHMIVRKAQIRICNFKMERMTHYGSTIKAYRKVSTCFPKAIKHWGKHQHMLILQWPWKDRASSQEPMDLGDLLQVKAQMLVTNKTPLHQQLTTSSCPTIRIQCHKAGIRR